MPRLDARDEEDARPPGLDGTEGRADGAPEDPAPEDRVAMAVGNTKDGSELPAKLGDTGQERDTSSAVLWLRIRARLIQTHPIFV